MRRLALPVAVAGVLALLPVAAASAAAPTETQLARDAGLTAYVHGYPPVLHRLSQATFPLDTLVGIASTTTPANRLIVLPNVDTAYSVARIDLADGPYVVHVPARAGRYYVLQLMDAYTNVFGYIGTRTTGSAAGDHALVGPGFHGTLPAGVTAIRSPTNDVLLLGRTLVKPGDDLASLRTLVGQYLLTPLATFAAGGTPPPGIVLDAQPVRKAPVLPRGLAFLDLFDQILTEDPPAAAELRVLAPLRRYGIGAGLTASTTALSPAVRAALIRGVADGPAHVDAIVARRRDRLHAGWSTLDPKTGDTGSDWSLRAVVAHIGLWANTPAEATYPMASDDDHGRPLSGAHRYRVTFAEPPPVQAFWSLTMYGAGLHLYANPLKRYALGDRSGLVRGPGASMTITLQHRAPGSAQSNWLPSPSGRFTVSLRLYIPKASVLSGRWQPPGIVCLDCGDTS